MISIYVWKRSEGKHYATHTFPCLLYPCFEAVPMNSNPPVCQSRPLLDLRVTLSLTLIFIFSPSFSKSLFFPSLLPHFIIAKYFKWGYQNHLRRKIFPISIHHFQCHVCFFFFCKVSHANTCICVEQFRIHKTISHKPFHQSLTIHWWGK